MEKFIKFLLLQCNNMYVDIKNGVENGIHFVEYRPCSIRIDKSAIFIPGMGEELNYRNCDFFPKQLAQEGILTYSFDLSGHGLSEDVPFSDDTNSEMVDYLVQEQLSQYGENIILAGHSYGGNLAMRKGQEYPDLDLMLFNPVIDMKAAVDHNLKGFSDILYKTFSLNIPIIKTPLSYLALLAFSFDERKTIPEGRSVFTHMQRMKYCHNPSEVMDSLLFIEVPESIENETFAAFGLDDNTVSPNSEAVRKNAQLIRDISDDSKVECVEGADHNFSDGTEELFTDSRFPTLVKYGLDFLLE